MIRRFIALLLCVELLALCAPLVVPDSWYLDYYLGPQALQSQANFYNNMNASVPNDDTGWANKPNFQRGSYIIDQWGGRHSHTVTLNKTPEVARYLFLGSSLVNGDATSTNNETMSFHFEHIMQESNQKVEALNFGTMVYRLDQMYIQLKAQLLKFSPDHVVIGLDINPNKALGNVYIPLFVPEEKNMPYLKPRFEFNANKDLIQISPPHQLAQQGNLNELSEFLAAHDNYYSQFTRFKYMHMTPILYSIDYFASKTQNFLDYLLFDETQYELTKALMHKIQLLSKEHNFKVSYLFFPIPRTFQKSLPWKYMPDFYQQRLDLLRQPITTNEPTFDVVDIREYMQNAQANHSAFFQDDNYHFTSQGNYEIAKALKDHLIQQ